MAHIHIPVQPTSFWWPHYLADGGGTTLNLRSKIWYLNCWGWWCEYEIFPPKARGHEAAAPNQLDHELIPKQQMGDELFGFINLWLLKSTKCKCMKCYT